MKQNSKYIIIVVLCFVLYGNTLFHDYALDDALVITENEYTLSGFKGIKDIFSKEFFSGFFDEKDKNLVAGGRYRPLSMATFAIEWQVIMGTPFDGINQQALEKRMNQNANPKMILPSQKLLKDLSTTIHTENRKLRIQQQEAMLNKAKVLTENEKSAILSKLEKMYYRRDILLFISHLMNVLLYSLTSIVLFILLRKLFRNYISEKWYLSLPLIATLIFIAHPIHTEVVANIKGRDEILSLLGSLLSVLFVFRYFEKQKYTDLIFVFICFLMGIFSKEVAVTFLVIIPLSIYFFSDSEKKVQLGIISFIPILLASIIYFYIRNRVVGGLSFEPGNELMNNSFLGMSFSERYATIFYTLILYIKLLIFPHPLTFDYYPYHIPITTWNNLWPILSLIFYLAIGIFALWGLKKKRISSFAILFYLITLSPMSNIFFPIGVFMNERFIYASSIGFVILLAYFLTQNVPVWLKNQKVISYLLIIMMSLYSVKTIGRNRAWKNDFTLFTTDVNTSYNSAKSNTSAGGKLIEEAIKPGNSSLKNEYLNRAIHYLRRAIDIYPKYKDALLLMGNAQWEMYHNLDSTFTYYEQILKMNPRYDRVYTNIFETSVYNTFEDPNKANENVRILSKLLTYNPGYFKTNYYLGRIYGRYLNDLESSKKYLEKAAQINPNNVEVFKDLGVAYGMSKDYKNSAIAFSKAMELDPNDLVLKVNVAMTYANLKDFKKAFDIMGQILKSNIDKKDASILINLAYLYRDMGQAQKSQECFVKAQKLNPELFKK